SRRLPWTSSNIVRLRRPRWTRQRRIQRTEHIRFNSESTLKDRRDDLRSAKIITGPSDFLTGLLSRKETDEKSSDRGRRSRRNVCRGCCGPKGLRGFSV